jgi:N-acetylneuraminic acid mutarotase
MKNCSLLVVLVALSFLLACGSGIAKFHGGPPPPTSSNEWTWQSGANVVNQPGVYGTLGTASSSNVPGARSLSFSWIDSSGSLWLFGGAESPTHTSDEFLNDLWKYSGGQWTWMGGSSSTNQTGTYGTQGVASSANIPGARQSGASWTDKSGNFWLFGGVGIDANGTSQYLNDLWKYSGGQWTWVAGPVVGGQSGVYGTQGTGSATTVPGARQPAASWIDANGNFWIFGGIGYDSAGRVDYLNDLWEYTGGQWVWISGSSVVDQPGVYGTQGIASTTNVPGARLESMGWTDSSGNLWLFGGSNGPDGQFHLFSDLWKFSSNQWTWISGPMIEDQIGSYGLLGTPSTSNIPGSRVSAMTWTDSSGKFWMFGGDGHDAVDNLGEMNDLWTIEGTDWTWIGGSTAVGQSGTYGTLGTPAAANIPGARTWAATWIDSSGNMWFFGGNGYDAAATLGDLNDLWEYTP